MLATDTWRILPKFKASSERGIVSVTTSSSITELRRLSIALPDKTG